MEKSETDNPAAMAAKTGNAWISPEGKIYPCEWYEHRPVAGRIIQEVGINISVETQMSMCYDDELARRNWVRFECEQFHIGFGWNINLLPAELATQKQLDSMFDIAIAATAIGNQRIMENYNKLINASNTDESELITEDLIA